MDGADIFGPYHNGGRKGNEGVLRMVKGRLCRDGHRSDAGRKGG